MSKKGGVDLGFASIAIAILFLIAAFIVILLVYNYFPVLQQGLETSVCKMNVFFRASTIGNPVIQSVITTTTKLIGGFGGVTVSLINIPLACKQGADIDYEDYVTLDVLTKKVMDESVRCWDMFGEGRYDVLVMYQGGNQFTCYEQTLTVKCDSNPDCSEDNKDACPEWIKRMYPMTYWQRYNELTKIDGEIVVDQAFFSKYANTHYFKVGDVERSYSEALGHLNPYLGSRGEGYKILCDGKKHKFIVGLYFVDKFFSQAVATPTETLCYTVPASQASDMLVLCTYEIVSAEVTKSGI